LPQEEQDEPQDLTNEIIIQIIPATTEILIANFEVEDSDVGNLTQVIVKEFSPEIAGDNLTISDVVLLEINNLPTGMVRLQYRSDSFPVDRFGEDELSTDPFLINERYWVVRNGDYTVVYIATMLAQNDASYRPFVESIIESTIIGERITPTVSIPDGFEFHQDIYGFFYLRPEGWTSLEDNFFVEIHPNGNVEPDDDEMEIGHIGALQMFHQLPDGDGLLSILEGSVDLDYEIVDAAAKIMVNGREVGYYSYIGEREFKIEGVVETCGLFLAVSGRAPVGEMEEFREMFLTFLGSIQ
jgi:hypothetical protein